MIIMAGTASPGGISQVILGYARDGVFEKWNIRWIRTHVPGGIIRKVSAALHGMCLVIFWMSCGRVELVHTHAAMRGSFWRKSWLVLVARFFSVPVIVHLHGSEMKGFYSSRKRFGKWWIRHTLEHADRVVVLSAGWARYIAEIAPMASVAIIPNYSPAVPAPVSYVPARKPTGNFVFLFLGALIDRKGIYELLPAFAKLSAEYPDTELWIGGGGEYSRVRDMIHERQLNNVKLLGWIDEPTKYQILRNVDAFVLPSKNENLPLALIEAMSAALPIVSTDVGGIPEMLVNGDDAVLVAPGRVDLLYEALKLVRTDKACSRRMSKNALKRYQAEFSPEIGLPKIDALYSEMSKKLNRRSSI